MSINVHINKFFAQMENQLPQAEVKEAISAAKLAITNWTSRNGNCFSNLFYRIGQIFMAIFGKSDWQFAVSKCQEAVLRFVKDINAKTTFPPKILAILDKVTSKGLESMVKYNERNFSEDIDPKSDKAFAKEIQEEWETFGESIQEEGKEAVKSEDGALFVMQMMQLKGNSKVVALMRQFENILR